MLPTGTGKTQLVRAAAEQCGRSFFALSPASVLSKWAGEGEKAIRAAFEEAAGSAPSILFMDECDALALSRDMSDNGGGADAASRRVLSELLMAMNDVGGAPGGGVLVVGATNRAGDLDPALLRRFSRKVHCGLPGPQARHGILTLLLRGVDIALSDEEWASLIDVTEGWNGADIRSLAAEASMAPVRELLSDAYSARFGLGVTETTGVAYSSARFGLSGLGDGAAESSTAAGSSAFSFDDGSSDHTRISGVRNDGQESQHQQQQQQDHTATAPHFEASAPTDDVADCSRSTESSGSDTVFVTPHAPRTPRSRTDDLQTDVPSSSTFSEAALEGSRVGVADIAVSPSKYRDACGMDQVQLSGLGSGSPSREAQLQDHSGSSSGDGSAISNSFYSGAHDERAHDDALPLDQSDHDPSLTSSRCAAAVGAALGGDSTSTFMLAGATAAVAAVGGDGACSSTFNLGTLLTSEGECSPISSDTHSEGVDVIDGRGDNYSIPPDCEQHGNNYPHDIEQNHHGGDRCRSDDDPGDRDHAHEGADAPDTLPPVTVIFRSVRASDFWAALSVVQPSQSFASSSAAL